jgi:4-amino-4-deoxy-L-arabinose transferase-like glycosyltransferase
LLALFRGESWLIVATLFVSILWIYRHKVRRALLPLVVATIVMIAVCSPWIVRNYMVFDRVVLTTSSFGFNFWRGNTYLFNWPETNYSKYFTTTGIDRNAEFKVDHELLKESIHWISTHRSIAIEHTAMKFGMLWGIDWYDPEARSINYIVIYLATLVCTITGIVSIRRTLWHKNRHLRDALTVLLAWFGAYSLIAVAFIPLPRLQIMLIGIIFPIVVVGADHWWQKRTRNKRPKIATGI